MSFQTISNSIDYMLLYFINILKIRYIYSYSPDSSRRIIFYENYIHLKLCRYSVAYQDGTSRILMF